MSTNLIALLVIIFRRDIVWCVAATWLCISLWLETPKPLPVYVPTIVFTILHPLALLLALVYVQFYAKERRRGHVALHGEDEALHSDRQNGPAGGGGGDGEQREEQREAREVDEATWG